MSDVDALVAWLHAALDEEAQEAAAACGDQPDARWVLIERECRDSAIIRNEQGSVVVYDEGEPSFEEARHIARWDPPRVLAEVEAKRARIDYWAGVWAGNDLRRPLAEHALKLEAPPYASRPGFREEWRLA